MNLITMEHISKTYGDKVIFDDVSCGIQQGEKIGIVGLNGAGKTTLLNLLAGEEQPEEGQVVKQNGLKLSYLPQSPSFGREDTVLSYVTGEIDSSDWTAVSEAKGTLMELGFTEFEERMETLSRGQQKKAALARSLTGDYDVLLLDEPTNHLDQEMLGWLEDFLRRYRGTVVMVTHDRYFLDRVCNRILEVSLGQIYSYAGDYSWFLERKAQREERELASERKRQSILRVEEAWAARGCRARSTKQKARLQRLEQLKSGSAPTAQESVELESGETRMGKKTLELHQVSKGYGGKKLVEDFDYIALRNQRLGIIGPNGCGKSTLLRMMAGLLEPDSGSVELGETVRVGYFAQEVPDMDSGRRVIDYIKDIAEYIPTRDGKITASQMLERFLFTPDMQYAPVNRLSGGEKKRLYLLSVLMQAPNFLALDEVTNDLDIPTMTVLEDYLFTFSGIVVAVSHDRYFLDNVADRILAFEGDGEIRQYEGGYTDCLEAKERREAAGVPGRGAACQALPGGSGKGAASGSKGGTGRQSVPGSSGKTMASAPKVPANGEASGALEGRSDARRQNRPAKLRFTFKEQREYEAIDGDIAALEEKIASLEGEIQANATNSLRLSGLFSDKEQAEAELEAKMERWVYLNDLAERIAAQGDR